MSLVRAAKKFELGFFFFLEHQFSGDFWTYN